MTIITINEKNLIADGTYKTVGKARCVLENNHGEVVICHLDGKPTFPGGKLDAGESPLEAVQRELSEETGICLSLEDFEELFTLEYITDEFGSFYDGSEGALSHRINHTTFFHAIANEAIDLTHTDYTDSEIRYGFAPTFIPVDEMIAEMLDDHSDALNGYHFDIENREVLSFLGWI